MKTFGEALRRLVSLADKEKYENQKASAYCGETCSTTYGRVFQGFPQTLGSCTHTIMAFIGVFGVCILYRYLAHAHTTERTHHDASAGHMGFSSGLTLER